MSFRDDTRLSEEDRNSIFLFLLQNVLWQKYDKLYMQEIFYNAELLCEEAEGNCVHI
jgi:hypothetical protein